MYPPCTDHIINIYRSQLATCCDRCALHPQTHTFSYPCCMRHCCCSVTFLGCSGAGVEAPPTPDGYRGPKILRPPKRSSLIEGGVPSLNDRPRKTCAIIRDSSEAEVSAMPAANLFAAEPPTAAAHTPAPHKQTAHRVATPTFFQLSTWQGNVEPTTIELALYALLWLHTVAGLSDPKWKLMLKGKNRNKKELGLENMRNLSIPSLSLVRGGKRNMDGSVVATGVAKLEPVVRALMRPDLLLMNSTVSGESWKGVTFNAKQLYVHIDAVHDKRKKHLRWKGDMPRWNAKYIKDKWWPLLQDIDFLCDAVGLLLAPPAPARLATRPSNFPSARDKAPSAEQSFLHVAVASTKSQYVLELAQLKDTLTSSQSTVQRLQSALKDAHTSIASAAMAQQE